MGEGASWQRCARGNEGAYRTELGGQWRIGETRAAAPGGLGLARHRIKLGDVRCGGGAQARRLGIFVRRGGCTRRPRKARYWRWLGDTV